MRLRLSVRAKLRARCRLRLKERLRVRERNVNGAKAKIRGEPSFDVMILE